MSLIFSTISDCPTHDSKMSVSVVLPAVAEMRNLLHKLEGDYFEVDDNKQQQGFAGTSLLTWYRNSWVCPCKQE
jgi:hypothetical protein